MGIFDNEISPGHESLRSCPYCDENAVGRRTISGGLWNPELEYYCDGCGAICEETDVKKSFNEIVETAKGQIKENAVDSRITDSELQKQVQDRQDEGWKVEEVTNGGNRVVMSSTRGGNFAGHAVTGFLTGFWTLGAGNVAYNELSKKRNRQRIVLRKEDTPVDGETTVTPDGIELLRELQQLHEDGVLTEEEFTSKKKELLGKL
jgi:hypothetical protein